MLLHSIKKSKEQALPPILLRIDNLGVSGCMPEGQIKTDDELFELTKNSPYRRGSYIVGKTFPEFDRLPQEHLIHYVLGFQFDSKALKYETGVKPCPKFLCLTSLSDPPWVRYATPEYFRALTAKEIKLVEDNATLQNRIERVKEQIRDGFSQILNN